MKLKYNKKKKKILELIHYRVVRADEVLERGKVYDIPNEIVDRCMETGFFEYVEQKKAPKKVDKEEEKE